MANFICSTYGTQYAESDQPPLACTICQDERQYVKKTGSVVQPEKTAGKAGEMRPAERQSCLADLRRLARPGNWWIKTARCEDNEVEAMMAARLK